MVGFVDPHKVIARKREHFQSFQVHKMEVKIEI
jgi:hypothetical protein